MIIDRDRLILVYRGPNNQQWPTNVDPGWSARLLQLTGFFTHGRIYDVHVCIKKMYIYIYKNIIYIDIRAQQKNRVVWLATRPDDGQ